MQHTLISHKKFYKGIIHECSSDADNNYAAANILTENGFWSSKKNILIAPEYFIIDYHEVLPVDYIEILSSPSGKAAFPVDFQIEASADGSRWKIIHSEKDYDLGDSTVYALDLPIISFRFIKFLITRPQKNNNKFYSEIGRFSSGIRGIKEISSSSSLSFDHDTDKLLDGSTDSCWKSNTNSKSIRESVRIDLGRPFNLSRLALSSSGLEPHGFPENISLEISTDNSIWTPLFDIKNFKSSPSTWYYWDLDLATARFINIEMLGVKLGVANFGVILSEIEIYSAQSDTSHMHSIGEMSPHASIFQAGMVKLAKNGEDAIGAAVQGNDARLRDAGTLFKGIVQLAEDGEVKEGLVIQSSDSRIQPATELKPGIVRFGYDREDKFEIAVRGNDSRLKDATEQQAGIVRLCPDGIYSDLSVVTGNDTRLHKATTSSFGICRIAENGESNSDCVVLGNDSRLREGTTNYKGIVELAEDGEDREGVTVQGNDKRLKDATTKSKGIVELAENGEDREGVAVQGNDKRLKDATTASRGIVEIAEDGEDREGVAVQGNDKRLKDATTKSKGIVELAENGEDREGVAVQGNDKRLKDATTRSKGIVELAEDGENKEGVAVQANDKRLKDATTLTRGIVELAEDGENKEGVAVQANDKRLKDATTSSRGIVELAEDGEDKHHVVVQGNDKRLKDATIKNKGIMKFADDGEDTPHSAVQGSDRRLKDASITCKGIVKLAENGEDKENTAVQGNDRRLKDATTKSKGIVELAKDGEDREGTAVQGNDRRLKYASEDNAGIVRFAGDGETRKNHVVQSTDSRLKDARTPLPHTHDYAPAMHEFNSHSGTIKINESKNERFSGIVPPPEESAVIHALNKSRHSGAVGIAGIANPLKEESKYTYGVLGHGKFVGVRGQSSGNPDSGIKGCGILGVSRFGAGGVFSSEHSYSIVADGYGAISEYDDSLELTGNGEALYVNGKSEFKGKIFLRNDGNDNNGTLNIVEMFEVDEEQYIMTGDILIASEAGGCILSRSKEIYTKTVIGVVSGNPAIIINNSGKEKKIYPVILAGKAACRIDARTTPVKPGDLIVTSDTPGCGMAGTIDSFGKIGCVIGKALDKLDMGIGIIPIFITHQ